jgi:xanthine dehydrogenase FAD-binding subunit
MYIGGTGGSARGGVCKKPLEISRAVHNGKAVLTIGGPQLRNIATIGGNICNGITSADSAPTLLAFDAQLVYKSIAGARTVPIKEHYLGVAKTQLKTDEILQEIIIPEVSYKNTFAAYIKYATREAMDIAILSCAANVQLSQNKKTIERLRLAYGVAAPIPIRASAAEITAQGKPANNATVELAAEAVKSDINVRTSWRGSKEFRTHLACELAKRTISAALKLAGAIE